MSAPQAAVDVRAPGLEERARSLARNLLWPAALVAGIAAFALVATHDELENAVAAATFTLVLGWLLVLTGLTVWEREERNPLGGLVAALGLVWLAAAAAGTLGARPSHWLASLGANACLALLVHVLLAFPSGRLRTPVERGLAAAAWGAFVALPLLWLAVRRESPPADGTAGLLIHPESVGAFWGWPQATAAVPLVLAVVAVLWWRWHWATRPLRRTLAAVLAAGGASLTLVVAAATAGRASAPASHALQWAAMVALGAAAVAFQFGLLRSRLARANVSELVRELEHVHSSGALRDALRRALGDPTLRLAYWVSETRGFVDLRGQPFELPWEGSSQVATTVERDGRCVAALIHDRALLDEPELLRAVTSAAGLALDNERLHAELRARVDEVRESRARIVEAGDAERRRLERNLHDGAQQRLVAISLMLRLAETKLEREPAAAAPMVARAREELAAALDELRELARGIHPAILTDRGLGPALEVVASRSPVPVELSAPAERLPAPVEAAIYYVVSEALANVAKYARASRVVVEVAHAEGRAVVAIADDGVGGADAAAGTGLRGLHDRVSALDGRLRIESEAGRGTRVVADLPLGGEA